MRYPFSEELINNEDRSSLAEIMKKEAEGHHPECLNHVIIRDAEVIRELILSVTELDYASFCTSFDIYMKEMHGAVYTQGGCGFGIGDAAYENSEGYCFEVLFYADTFEVFEVTIHPVEE